MTTGAGPRLSQRAGRLRLRPRKVQALLLWLASREAADGPKWVEPAPWPISLTPQPLRCAGDALRGGRRGTGPQDGRGRGGPRCGGGAAPGAAHEAGGGGAGGGAEAAYAGVNAPVLGVSVVGKRPWPLIAARRVEFAILQFHSKIDFMSSPGNC